MIVYTLSISCYCDCVMVGTKSYPIADWNSKLFEKSIVFVHFDTRGAAAVLVFQCALLMYGRSFRSTADIATLSSRHSGNREIYMHLCFCHFVSIYICWLFSIFRLPRCVCCFFLALAALWCCLVEGSVLGISHMLCSILCAPIYAHTTWTVLWYHYSDDSMAIVCVAV